MDIKKLENNPLHYVKQQKEENIKKSQHEHKEKQHKYLYIKCQDKFKKLWYHRNAVPSTPSLYC